MRIWIALLVLACALPQTLPASEFDWMVREFSRQSGAEPTHIPFLGVARFVVAVAHPAGASGLKLAVFEHPNVAPGNFSQIADSVAGSNWRPAIRIRAQSGDVTNIYFQPQGKRIRVLIATLDGSDATFVEVHVRPEELIKFVDEHRH